tara:strand:+ start:956 stop:1144 length:189 start_codon:yes stop_codon:yes gene_type:complete
MRNFLLQCITNDVESNTATSIDILLEDREFNQMAFKLLEDVNQDNYEDIAKKLSDYANEHLI